MLYFLVSLLVGAISVLLLVNVYLMWILCRHRRQLRRLGVRPISSSRRRRLRHPASPEAEDFVSDRGTNGRLPPPSTPELSRRAVPQRPHRPPPLAGTSPLTTPTSPASPPGRVHLPPRDSPVFVHVESPRESPLLGRVPPPPGAAELLPQSVDGVSSPPSLGREGSPIWVRLAEETGEAAPSDTTDAALPPEERLRTATAESPVWVHLPFDDSTSTTMPPVAVPVSATHPSVEVAPSQGRGQPRSAPPTRAEGPLPATISSRSYSNPYRQDTYDRRTIAAGDRPRTPQRSRQRRLLR